MGPPTLRCVYVNSPSGGGAKVDEYPAAQADTRYPPLGRSGRAVQSAKQLQRQSPELDDCGELRSSSRSTAAKSVAIPILASDPAVFRAETFVGHALERPRQSTTRNTPGSGD